MIFEGEGIKGLILGWEGEGGGRRRNEFD